MNLQSSSPATGRRRIRGLLSLLFAAAFVSVSAHAQLPANPPAQQAVGSQSSAQPQPTQQQPQQPQAGQQPANDQASDQPTITIQANEVNLIFTVTDKHGHYIANLQQSDFALLDDGKAPARITSFRQQINLPLRVGLVIDASTSIRTRFQFEQQ